MNNEPKISIIVVNWNGEKWLKACFDSIWRQTYKNWEIVLVDNNSSDNSLVFVQSNYPEIKIIRNNDNFGFGKANNIGVAKCFGDELFFLNNDTILEDGTIEKIFEYKKNNDLQIVGPKILAGDKHDIYQGRKLSVDWTGYLGWGEETFYIDGSALMISREDFAKLGGFDEKYFMYGEDIDLCWRASLYGMNLGICQAATLIHFGGGSSESTRYQKNEKYIVPMFRRYEVEKNNLRNILKNYHWSNVWWVALVFMIIGVGEAVAYLLTGNRKISSLLLKSYHWNIKNIKDTLKERKIIQNKRNKSDKEIMKRMTGFIPNKLKALLIVGFPKFK